MQANFVYETTQRFPGSCHGMPKVWEIGVDIGQDALMTIIPVPSLTRRRSVAQTI